MRKRLMRKRLRAVLGGVVLAVGLVAGATSSAWAAPAPAAAPGGVHQVYCQTPQYETYVKFRVQTATPGGGPLCYTGVGTASIDLHGVTWFDSGAHSGSFEYRTEPGLPIFLKTFQPHQSMQFSAPSEVISLTIRS